MKRLLYILFPLLFAAVPHPVTAQNLYTNAPELVYPVLEEFVAENFYNGVSTFELLNRIDSIVVRQIPYPYTALHTRKGENHNIEIHPLLVKYPRRFERSLKHELGHVMGLPHIPTNEGTFWEFMSSEHWEEVADEYQDPQKWRKANQRYYKSLRYIPR